MSAELRRPRPVRWVVEAHGQTCHVDEAPDGDDYVVDLLAAGPHAPDLDTAYRIAVDRCQALAELAEHRAAARALEARLHGGDDDPARATVGFARGGVVTAAVAEQRETVARLAEAAPSPTIDASWAAPWPDYGDDLLLDGPR